MRSGNLHTILKSPIPDPKLLLHHHGVAARLLIRNQGKAFPSCLSPVSGTADIGVPGPQPPALIVGVGVAPWSATVQKLSSAHSAV